MTGEEYEKERKRQLKAVDKIIKLLIKEEMTLNDAQRVLGYAKNRIEDQINAYKNDAKISKRYKKPLDHYEMPG